MQKDLKKKEELRLSEFFNEGLKEEESAEDYFIEKLEDGKVLKLRKNDYTKIEDHTKSSAQRFRYEKRQK